jgi:hypothetical protein
VLAASGGRRRRIVWVLAVIGVAESIAAPLPLSPLPDVRVHQVLSSDLNRQAAVLPVPFGIRDGFGQRGLLQHEALYAQTLHGHAMAGGFLARVSPKVWVWYDAIEPYRSLLQLSQGAESVPLPSCPQIAEGLQKGKVSYVSLDRQTAPGRLLAFVENEMPLRRVGDDGRYALYRIAPERCATQ